MNYTTYFHKCLLEQLPEYLALGYIEITRSWQESSRQYQVLLEWTHAGPPPHLERR